MFSLVIHAISKAKLAEAMMPTSLLCYGQWSTVNEPWNVSCIEIDRLRLLFLWKESMVLGTLVIIVGDTHQGRNCTK